MRLAAPRTATRRAGLLLVAAALGLGACGDEPSAAPSPLPQPGPAAKPADPGRAKQPLETALPEAPPLTPDGARRVLLEAIEASPGPEVVREALLALAATADANAVRTAATRLLAKGDDLGYADAESAAMAFEALVRAGDADAEKSAIALATAGLAEDAAYEAFVPMLAAVRGASAEARKLLVRLADDPIAYAPAVAALAELREPSAAARLHDVATDPDEDPQLRATAAVGLLAAGDPRASAVLDDLVRGTEADLTSFDVIDGLAVAGSPEGLPWIRKIADPIIAEGSNCTVEIASTAGAHVDVRGFGKGTPEDLAYLRGLLGKDDGLSDDEVVVALWSLGDDAQTAAAANVLAKYVAGVTSRNFDEELAVRILEALAVRGGAADRVFGRAVDAAAAVPVTDDPKRPDAVIRAWRVRVAAAKARLKS